MDWDPTVAQKRRMSAHRLMGWPPARRVFASVQGTAPHAFAQAMLVLLAGAALGWLAWGEGRAPALAALLPVLVALSRSRTYAFLLGLGYTVALLRHTAAFIGSWFDDSLLTDQQLAERVRDTLGFLNRWCLSRWKAPQGRASVRQGATREKATRDNRRGLISHRHHAGSTERACRSKRQACSHCGERQRIC